MDRETRSFLIVCVVLWLFLFMFGLAHWAEGRDAEGPNDYHPPPLHFTPAPPKRDPKQVRAYLKTIGLTKTPKGCQVDHIIPLHCGGPDRVENLQLICGASLKAKEKAERNCELFQRWSNQCLDLE